MLINKLHSFFSSIPKKIQTQQIKNKTVMIYFLIWTIMALATCSSNSQSERFGTNGLTFTCRNPSIDKIIYNQFPMTFVYLKLVRKNLQLPTLRFSVQMKTNDKTQIEIVDKL